MAGECRRGEILKCNATLNGTNTDYTAKKKKPGLNQHLYDSILTHNKCYKLCKCLAYTSALNNNAIH